MQSDRTIEIESGGHPEGTRARPAEHPRHDVPLAPGYVSEAETEHEDAAEAHVHLPPRSIWPVTLAFGVAVSGTGMVMGWQGADNLIIVVGVLIIAYALASWVQELRHESH